MVVDLDAFDANADDLVRRAAGKPIRVASKSVRVPELLRRALARDGFHGVLSFTLREALWLYEQSISDDLVVAYPTVDREAVRQLVASPAAASAITLMVDDVAHLDLVDSVRSSRAVQVRVAVDIDAGLRVGGQHVGPKRSPLYDTDAIIGLVRAVVDRPGFHLAGVMTYEGQIAGLPDTVPTQKARSLIVRRLKHASVSQLEVRRREIADAIAEVAELEFWNAGGSGSVDSTTLDPVVTEIAAGSGLLVPGLFDHYESFQPHPAAYFGLPVARRPNDEMVTVHGGGLVASGAAGKDRLPIPWAPSGLHLTSLEGAGEVQTPLTGPGVPRLQDRRPGVVPARQGRRAVRAHQHRPTAGGRRVRRRGADVPRVRAGVLMAGVVPVETVAAVLDHALAQPARLGSGRLVCVDGPAGSGKSTLARAVAEAGQQRVPSVHVIHTDDLLDGWRGPARARAAASTTAWSSRSRPAGRRGTGATTGSPERSPRSTSWPRWTCSSSTASAPATRYWHRTGPPWSGSRPTTSSASPAGWPRRRGDAAGVGAVHAGRGGVLRRTRRARTRGPETRRGRAGSSLGWGPCFLPPASSSRSVAASTAPW